MTTIQCQSFCTHEVQIRTKGPTLTKFLFYRDEIVQVIIECRAKATSDAERLGLVVRDEMPDSCNVQPFFYRPSRKKATVSSVLPYANQNMWSRILSYMRAISLRNFAVKFDGQDVEPNRPYVEIPNDIKRIVVKKTTLCWLLRSDHVKLSSDRLERVKAVCGTKKLTLKRNSKP